MTIVLKAIVVSSALALSATGAYLADSTDAVVAANPSDPNACAKAPDSAETRLGTCVPSQYNSYLIPPALSIGEIFASARYR